MKMILIQETKQTQKVIKLAEEINIDRRERTDLKKFKKTHRLFSSLLGNEDLGRSVLQEDLVSGERCTEFLVISQNFPY